jgi:hypothetical protein
VPLPTFVLDVVNETLAATIVVLAASILLYNVTRNLNNRVARTSAVLLGCVTITYLVDVFVALGPDSDVYAAALRIQWLGIAFMPAASFHLSDALLATTGLSSRGRRRRVVRLMYVISAAFLLLALFTNDLIRPISVATVTPPGSAMAVTPGQLFPVYIAYFVVAIVTAFITVQRARQRCIARSTRRRMGYLQFAMLTPAIGIFPFSLILGAGTEFTLLGLVLVNLANLFVVLMLLFLAYPLSFFGSNIPDRVVKTELLRFILRGPATGLLALATFIFTNASSQILGLQGEEFTPFAIVAVILLWQWSVALGLPWLERRLVYNNDDDRQFDKVQTLSDRLLTRSDLLQVLEALLESVCDFMRVNTAYVAAYLDESLEIIRAVGPSAPAKMPLGENGTLVRSALAAHIASSGSLLLQDGFWMIPLVGQRDGAPDEYIGVLAIQAKGDQLQLDEDEQVALGTFATRAAQALEDITLQGEIFAALEGLLPQINLTRRSTEDIEYRPGRSGVFVAPTPQFDREQFNEQVRAALKQYWGGPGLTNSRLLELCIVHNALVANDNNAVKALRVVLVSAMEQLRPEGERKIMNPEWTLYSILEMRFLKGQKVREVANRLAMSEPDFFRKQRIAIDHVAEVLWEMESSCQRIQS